MEYLHYLQYADKVCQDWDAPIQQASVGKGITLGAGGELTAAM